MIFQAKPRQFYNSAQLLCQWSNVFVLQNIVIVAPPLNPLSPLVGDLIIQNVNYLSTFWFTIHPSIIYHISCWRISCQYETITGIATLFSTQKRLNLTTAFQWHWLWTRTIKGLGITILQMWQRCIGDFGHLLCMQLAIPSVATILKKLLVTIANKPIL